MATFRALYVAFPVANIPRGILSTKVTPVMCRMRADGQIRFEYGYVWTWKFLNPERKICGLKNIRMRLGGALNEAIDVYDFMT